MQIAAYAASRCGDRVSQSMVEKGIGIMVVMIVLVGVAVPFVQDAIVTDLTSVTNETITSPTGTTPETLTLSEAVDGVADNSNLVVFATEQDTGTTAELPAANVTVLPDNTEADLNVTAGADLINSTDDEYNVSYDGKPDGYIDSASGRTVLSFLPLMLALAAFVAAIALVR